MKRQSTVRFGYLVLALFLGLPAVVSACPRGPGSTCLPSSSASGPNWAWTSSPTRFVTHECRDRELARRRAAAGVWHQAVPCRLHQVHGLQLHLQHDQLYEHAVRDWTSGSAKDYFSQVSYNMFTLAGGSRAGTRPPTTRPTMGTRMDLPGRNTGQAGGATGGRECQLRDVRQRRRRLRRRLHLHSRRVRRRGNGNGSDICRILGRSAAPASRLYHQRPAAGYPGQYIKIDNYVIDQSGRATRTTARWFPSASTATSGAMPWACLTCTTPTAAAQAWATGA